MSMFDTLQATHIVHDKFKHEHTDKSFQTKDFDCNMDDYIIFRNRLYKRKELSPKNLKLYDYVACGFTGEASICTYIEENKITCWHQYDLLFKNGLLVDILNYHCEITEDKRDITRYEPKKNNNVKISIDVSNCDQETIDKFIGKDSDEIINGLKSVIGTNKIQVTMPIKDVNIFPGYRMVYFVTQDIQDFSNAKKIMIDEYSRVKSNLPIVLDEFHLYKS